jgi:hypothetical protein
MIRWSSRLSLATEADRLDGLRLEVYAAIKAWDPVKDGPGPTREQLAERLGRKESSICGRVNELMGYRHKEWHLDLAVIERGPMVTNPSTGKPAETLVALGYRAETLRPQVDPRTGQTSFLDGLDIPPSPAQRNAYS